MWRKYIDPFDVWRLSATSNGVARNFMKGVQTLDSKLKQKKGKSQNRGHGDSNFSDLQITADYCL